MQARVDIVPRLWQAAESIPSVAGLLNEAAAEIEYLRQRCEQIDHEWRQTVEGRNGRI